MTTMNTTTDHRAVACIRFVRRLFWPIAALTAPLCILWPWLFWVTIIAAAADMVCNRIEFNARMKEMDRIWEHEREERKRELLERLEGPPNAQDDSQSPAKNL